MHIIEEVVAILDQETLFFKRIKVQFLGLARVVEQHRFLENLSKQFSECHLLNKFGIVRLKRHRCDLFLFIQALILLFHIFDNFFAENGVFQLIEIGAFNPIN